VPFTCHGPLPSGQQAILKSLHLPFLPPLHTRLCPSSSHTPRASRTRAPHHHHARCCYSRYGAIFCRCARVGRISPLKLAFGPPGFTRRRGHAPNALFLLSPSSPARTLRTCPHAPPRVGYSSTLQMLPATAGNSKSPLPDNGWFWRLATRRWFSMGSTATLGDESRHGRRAGCDARHTMAVGGGPALYHAGGRRKAISGR